MAQDSLGTLTVDLLANTGGFEKGMDRAQRTLKATTKEAAYQATQMEKLLGSLDPVRKAQNDLANSQAKLAKALNDGTIGQKTYDRYTGIIRDKVDALKTSTDTAASTFGKFDRQMAANGQTLKQYQNNLRGVPAQFTDIFTSLQGGQAPFTVLIQQGGQLKDMFGGIGPAAKALGGYVLGLVNPFTVAAGAAIALGIAYKQGSDETTAYNTALALTGNTAGTTASELTGLAQQVAASSGTVGKAAEVLAQLASSTRIPVESFEMIAEAAVKFETATGQAASETVKNFEAIAKDPVAASLKLNESLNYLTASTYEQIKALQDQGDAAGAANLAEGEYAKALNDRSDKIKTNLGSIETGWNAVKNAAKNAWDAVLNVGREKTLDDQIANLDQQLNAIADAAALKNKRNSRGQLVDPLSALTPDDTFRQQELQQQKTDLLVQKSEETKRAAAKATAQQLQQDMLATQMALDKSDEEFATQATKRAKEIGEYKILVSKRAEQAQRTGDSSLLISQEDQAKRIAEINDKYQDRKTARAKAYVEDAGTKELDQAKQQYAVLQQQSQQLDEQTGKVKALGPAQQELIKWEQQLADIKSKQTLTAAQKSLLATSDQITAQKMLNANLEKETAERKASAEQAKQLAEFTQSQADALSRFQQGLDNQVAGVGLGAEGRKRLQEDLSLQQDYANQVERLRRDKLSGKITQDTYDKETAILQDSLDKRLAAVQANYAKMDIARGQWQNGMSSALQDYVYEAGDIAGQSYTLFSDAFKGIEDVFVDAATTGKVSFKSFADSIIADLARIVARAYIVAPILSALGLGGSTSGLSASGVSALGGTSATGISGLLSNATSAISLAGSSFGKSIISGFNSGEGVIGGIKNAFSSGADYIGSSITSAFASGSASASNAAASLAAGASQAGYTGAAYQGYVSSANASASLASLSSTLSYVGAVYSVISSFQNYGAKGAATTAGFAAAGAAIGSVVPVLGTALGAALGSVIGSFASGKLFGGSGEKYADLSTSAQGTYLNGMYTTGGTVRGWQNKAPKYGSSVDAQLDSTVAKFTSTLGNLYTAFGSAAQVYAYDLLQVRKTSGKYSTTFGATIDGGGADDLNIHQQFSAADAAEALQHNYDDIMGTFLAKAIVSSKSLPEYFRAQFTDFADSWDTTADEVIKAIEDIFTKFDGVNTALNLINVNALKLDDTGLAASDSVLNMVGAIAGLDTASASAKDKVDALNTAVETYYKAFFSADEQFADLTESLKTTFAGFGLDIPATREAYRGMVEDIDLTTDAGQALFSTLIGLASNADSYYSHLDEVAQAAEQAAATAAQAAADAVAAANTALLNGASSAFSALQKSIAAEQQKASDVYNALTTSLNDMLSTASDRVSDLTSISSSLNTALKALNGTSDDAAKMLRAQAQATLQNALATVRAGGTLQGFDGLDDALDTVSNNTTDLYSSLAEFNADQNRTANLVAQLEAVNGKQLTSAETTVATLKSQLKVAQDNYQAQQAQFQAQLDFAQQQLDALNGVDNSVKSVADAIKVMNASVVAALSLITNPAAISSSSSGSIIDTAYQSVLGRNADAAGKAYWQQQLSSGAVTYGQLIEAITNAAVANGSIAKRATGGTTSGLTWVGEAGPELVATGRASVYSAAQSKAIMSGSGSSASEEIQMLREYLEAVLYPVALNTAEISKNTKPILRWDQNGLPATDPESLNV